MPVTVGRMEERTALVPLVVEHAMRICGDESLVAELRHVAPGSRGAYSALGRLLSATSATLAEGTPLLRLGDPNAPLLGQWREVVGVTVGSLWERLEFLESLWGAANPARQTVTDPLARLLALEDTADRDIGDAAHGR